MRSLKRNKQTIWYANYAGRTPVYELDADGQPLIDPQTGEKIETGDYIDGYEKPVKIEVNVSAGQGEAEADVFGVSINYDRVICTTDMSLPITESTLIWKETKPTYNADGSVNKESADYRVAATPAKSLNSMLVAISKNRKGGVTSG